MIHITKARSGKLMVVVVAGNGELLSHSELLNSKKACIKNIASQIKCFDPASISVKPQPGVGVGISASVLVQDDSGRLIKTYSVYRDGSHHLVENATEASKYIPGKNKKKK